MISTINSDTTFLKCVAGVKFKMEKKKKKNTTYFSVSTFDILDLYNFQSNVSFKFANNCFVFIYILHRVQLFSPFLFFVSLSCSCNDIKCVLIGEVVIVKLYIITDPYKLFF